MLTVAVGAHRRVGLPAGNELAVDALPEVVLDALVTLATGEGDVWLMLDSGEPGPRILWAVPPVEWQSLQVAAT